MEGQRNAKTELQSLVDTLCEQNGFKPPTVCSMHQEPTTDDHPSLMLVAYAQFFDDKDRVGTFIGLLDKQEMIDAEDPDDVVFNCLKQIADQIFEDLRESN